MRVLRREVRRTRDVGSEVILKMFGFCDLEEGSVVGLTFFGE